MRILVWNCRGLGGPSTVSQLKESIRLNLPDFILLSETKQTRSFIGTVCRHLKYGSRWEVQEPQGRKGGMLAAWNQNIEVKQIKLNDFCVELLVEDETEGTPFWVIFVHASTDARERRRQWEYLITRKEQWGTQWVMGGISMR